MSVIAAGFGDTIHDSQACFRQLLTTMSRPGVIGKLDLAKGFGCMMPATTQVLLALADNSTPTWLSTQFAHEPNIVENLNFHLGCTLLFPQNQSTDSQPKVTFGVIAEQDLASFDWQQAIFYMGCEEYPDRSTTVIVEVGGISDEAAMSNVDTFVNQVTLNFTGPGIKQNSRLVLESVTESAMNAMLSIRNSFRFPLGLDFIFVSGEQVVSIPRSTKVELLSCM